MSCSDIFLGIVAIIFPPIAVWIKSGLCTADSLINILLCMLGYLPGLLHAWYIIAKYPEHDYDRVQDLERQDRVTYYYVSHDQAQAQGGRRQYGTQGQGRAPAVPGNKPQHAQQQSGVVRTDGNNASSGSSRPAPATNSSSSVGAGPQDDAAPPPSYSEVVRGDNKIQSQD